MDRVALQRKLRRLDWLVADATAKVNRQRRLIEKLQRNFRDTTAALAALEHLRAFAKKLGDERTKVATQLISPEIWNAEPMVPNPKPGEE